MIKVFMVEWNRPDVWEQCAISWKQNASDKNNVQVFYADNASPDPEMCNKLSESKSKEFIDSFIVFDEKIHPATARNYFWLKEMANSNDNDIFVKADGNYEALQDWDNIVMEYLNENKHIGCVALGADENINIEHCIHRAYQIIFARQPIVKQFGGFRSYEKETGVLWGCDDIDWARVSLKTTYNSVSFKCFKCNLRPNNLKCSNVEKAKESASKRIRILNDKLNKYRSGNYYIGE